uniref:Transmembrane protein 69 n=1 Tax=Graphocephala atropunctata TaxID=36148 RepID=A0A1B6L5C2_9HEMI
MFRLLLTRRLLPPRPLPALTLTADSPIPTPAAICLYDVRCCHRNPECHRPLLPSQHLLHPLSDQRLLPRGGVRWASQFQVPDPAQIACNMINMLKCVDLNNLKDAPAPDFWTGIAAGGTQLFIPFLELVGGYSPVLTLLQLNLAAVTLGYFSGVKWGLALSNNPEPPPTWDTMRWCLLAPTIAVIGLQLPYALGFPTVAAGVVTSLYLDLKSCAYPPWGLAMALYSTLTTVTGLMLALMAYVLFHNREKEKKKKLKDRGEREGDENADDGQEGGKDGKP